MSGSSRVAAGIFSSRIVGLGREILIGAVLGRSLSADAFRAAMRIPNMIQNLLGEGAISASFVPVFARLVEDEQTEESRTLAGAILGHLAALVGLLVVVTMVGARPLVWLVTLGQWTGVRYEWAIELTRITAAGAGLLVLAAFCLGVLNSHRQYFLPYAAPVLWSGAQILALLVILVFLTEDGATEISATARRLLAGAVVAGSFAQFAIQWPAVRRLTGALRPTLHRSGPVRDVFSRFVPALAARGVIQLSSFVDLALASFLVAGAVATLGMVTPLYILSISVFGFSVATAELTEISRSGLLDNAVARRVRIGLRRVLLPTGLVAPILIVGAHPVVDGLYGWLSRLLPLATLDDGDITVTALTLTAFSLGLPAAMQARVTQNALFALGDVRGPARISLIRLCVVAVIGFILALQFDHLAIAPEAGQAGPAGLAISDGPFDLVSVNSFPHWPPWEAIPSPAREAAALSHLGPVGLGLASTVASWVEFTLLHRRLRRGVATPVATGIVISVLAGASVVAVVSLAVVLFVPLPSPLPLLVLGPAALASYILTLRWLGLSPARMAP